MYGEVQQKKGWIGKMSAMNKLQEWMERAVAPVAETLNRNKTIQAMSSGLLGTMPVTLGVSAICILAFLPIPGWAGFLERTGITSTAYEVMQATISMLAIYLVLAISYNYAKRDGKDGIVAAVISLGCYLAMIPQYIAGDGYFFVAMESRYLGSDGIFVGMLIAIVVSKLYVKLADNEKLLLKMPDTVPPMVTQSLRPVFVSMILFTGIAAVKYVLSLTPYGDLFTMVNKLIATPVMNLGATPWSLIIVYTFASFVWFFGIHPGPVLGIYTPVITSAMAANISAFSSGEQLPYYTFMLLYLCVYFSGTGNTIGLTISMLKAKSERYKALCPICLIPNIFNINEPVVFGAPIMLNPIFFIPMILSTLIPGMVGLLGINLLSINYNPSIEMPWVTPAPVTAFFQGGGKYFLLISLLVALSVVIWYPFFRIADKRALEEEKAES